MNADVNATLNILIKSKGEDISLLYRSGEGNTPVRIRGA